MKELFSELSTIEYLILPVSKAIIITVILGLVILRFYRNQK